MDTKEKHPVSVDNAISRRDADLAIIQGELKWAKTNCFQAMRVIRHGMYAYQPSSADSVMSHVKDQRRTPIICAVTNNDGRGHTWALYPCGKEWRVVHAWENTHELKCDKSLTLDETLTLLNAISPATWNVATFNQLVGAELDLDAVYTHSKFEIGVDRRLVKRQEDIESAPSVNGVHCALSALGTALVLLGFAFFCAHKHPR